MPKRNPEDEANYYYNIARKEEEEKETPEERAKYKLEAKNEKIWNRYRYLYPFSIRDIADQQDISLVRAYQIVLDYGGIEMLQQTSDYKEVNDEIENEKLKQENILKLEKTTYLGKGNRKSKKRMRRRKSRKNTLKKNRK